MNRFFRRFGPKRDTPNPQSAYPDDAKHENVNNKEVVKAPAEATPTPNAAQNAEPHFALSPENDTPKTLTLTTPKPHVAALHTATPIEPSAKDAQAISASNNGPSSDSSANKVSTNNVPATDALGPKPLPNEVATPQRVPKAEPAKVDTGPEQNTDQRFALSGENNTPKGLTLTTSTPSKAALHTATPVDTPASAESPTSTPSPVVIAQPEAPKKSGIPATQGGRALIQLENVNKAYQTPVGEFIALSGINLAIGRGEFVAVVGKSGSGKSTLINMITGIDRPTSGEIYIDDTPIHNLAEGPMAEWRGRNIGIIFQFFQLLPMLSCIENVMLPMDFCNMFKPSERESRALHLLEQVDMVEHAYKLPSEVSGGQQQRVAIARALANDPPLLVADEPTGNLDSRTADAVFHLFARMVDEGKTILMVTHDDEMAHQVRRTITLTDGRIVDDQAHEAAPTPTHDAQLEGEESHVADPAAVGV